MKKSAGLVVGLLLVLQPALYAQQKRPLVMRVMVDWTVAGSLLGAAVGAAIWLTDPGKPGNKFSDNFAGGAAWGSIAGAGFGIYIINITARGPAFASFTPGPLDPSQRITRDPIAAEDARHDLLAGSGGGFSGGFIVPLLNFRF